MWKWQKPAICVGLRARASVKKQGSTVVFKGQANGRGPWRWRVLIEKGSIVWFRRWWCKRRKSSIEFGDWWDWLLLLLLVVLVLVSWSICVWWWRCCFQNFHRLSWTIFPSVHVPLTVLRIWVCLFGAPPFFAISSSTPPRLRVYFSPQTHLQIVPSNCTQQKKSILFVKICTLPTNKQTQWHRKRERKKKEKQKTHSAVAG